MRISGTTNSLPIHIAKAYNAKPAAAASVNQPASLSPLASIGPSPRAADAYQSRAAIQQLVAGNVNKPVSFDAHSTVPSPQAATAATPSFQLYTRAADKMEAAVGVQLGRTLDVKG